MYEHIRHTSCTVSDLIVGNEYYFRVYSENICGLSDSPGVSKNTAHILKTGGLGLGRWAALAAAFLTPTPSPRYHPQAARVQGA